MVYPGVVCRVLLSYLIGVTLQLRFYGFVLGYNLATFANGLPSMWAFLREELGKPADCNLIPNRICGGTYE